jgi:hypothetical protein
VTSRIKGPGGSDGPRRIEGVDDADAVDQTRAAERPEKAGGPGGPGPTDAVARVAAQLRAGEIDVERAVELLIEHTLSQQAGAAASPKLAEKLRGVLERYVKDDPLLAGRIQRLNLRK